MSLSVGFLSDAGERKAKKSEMILDFLYPIYIEYGINVYINAFWYSC
jgi:hypothetical protein